MAHASKAADLHRTILVTRSVDGCAGFSSSPVQTGAFTGTVTAMIMALIMAVSACTDIRQGIAVLTHHPHQDARSAPAGLYISDPDHASVHFSVMHLGYSAFTGRFNDVDASLVFNPEDPTESHLSVSVKADSVDSNVPAIDKAIRSDLLKTDRFPEILFTAQTITLTDETNGAIKGVLTMAGRSHEMVLHSRFNGGARNPLTGLYTLGFSANGQIDRRDWALNSWLPAVAGDVTIRIEIEFVQSDAPAPALSENSSPH